jgi:D-alanyl-D-alanine carboxypeptidase
VFNAGDSSAIRKMHETKFTDSAGMPPVDARVDADTRLRIGSGGFELRKIAESSMNRIVAIMTEKSTGRWARIELETDPQEPHRIRSFRPQLIAPPADSESNSKPVAKAANVIDEIRKRMQEISSSGGFSGVVELSRNGKSLFAEAYGDADREAREPNRLDTKFNLGSMNKMFTAVAIAQLVQAGKLRFQDPLDKYLRDYPNKAVASRLTIHHLLTHTGGTGDIFGPQMDSVLDRLRELKDYVKLYGDRPLDFEPGTRHEYSNYGFILLGRIIEEVSGQSYYDYVRDHVFRLAGMANSGYFARDEKVPNLAMGYMNTPLGLERNLVTLPYRGTSAGGGYSNAEDLVRFAAALTSHVLLNREYTDMITTPKVQGPPGIQYCYGFMEGRTASGMRWFGHNGGAPGVGAFLQILPDSGQVLVILANRGERIEGRVASMIDQLL